MIAKRALIVDDSRTACAVLARMLKPYGIESDSVYSAEEALEFLQGGHKPDLIFMDHTMPGMDGLETVKLIKDDPNTAMIPVMMYTARSGELYVGQARALGAIDVLPKELKPTMVEQALHKLGVLKSQDTSTAGSLPFQQVAKVDEMLPVASATALTGAQNMRELSESSIEEYVHAEFGKMREDMAYIVANSLTELQNDYIRQTRRLLKQYASQHEERAEVNHKVLLQDFHQYSDFKESMLVSENRKRYWTLASGLLVTVGFVGWLFVDSGKVLLHVQEMGAQAAATFSLLQHMEGRLGDLEGVVQKLRDDVSVDGNTGPDSPNRISVTQSAQRGDLSFGKLLGYSEDGRLLNVMTDAEYTVQLDVKGQLASKVPVRYFVSAGCYGESYVDAHEGVVFVGHDRTLWYTPKKSELKEILPRYQQSQAGDCVAYTGQSTSISLRELQANDPRITKIDKLRYDLSR